MTRAVGVEITEASVRLLSYEQAGKAGKILGFHQTPIEADAEIPWEDRAARALKEAFAASKAPKSRVVAAVDSGHAILRELTLPFKNEDQIRKTVRFELESLIHNHSIDDLVVAYYKTGETDKGTLLLAAAVPKEVVGRTLRVFEKAGVDPVAVDLDVCAVFNAMKHAGAIDSDEPHLLIYGTSKFTKLILVEERKPRSIRTIRFSLPEEAEAAPRPSKPPPQDESAFVILEEGDAVKFHELDPGTQGALVEILAKEVSRFLLAHAATASPSRILLAGDFEDPGPASRIEAATKIPVRTFNLMEAMGGAGDRSARVAAPLGLALKGAGADALGMDFRQDEFQYKKKFDALKTTALVTAELLIVMLAALALFLWFKRTDLREANRWLLDEQLKVYWNVTVSDELKDPVQAYPKLAELYRKAAAEGGQDGPLVESGRTAWIALFDALRRFQTKYAGQKLGGGELYLEIDGVEIQQTTTSGNESLTLSFRGKIRNHEYAGVLKNEVRAADIFANADWSAPFTPLEGGLYQFSLKATKSKAKRNV